MQLQLMAAMQGVAFSLLALVSLITNFGVMFEITVEDDPGLDHAEVNSHGAILAYEHDPTSPPASGGPTSVEGPAAGPSAK